MSEIKKLSLFIEANFQTTQSRRVACALEGGRDGGKDRMLQDRRKGRNEGRKGCRRLTGRGGQEVTDARKK